MGRKPDYSNHGSVEGHFAPRNADAATAATASPSSNSVAKPTTTRACASKPFATHDAHRRL